jgi:hypothetical protein
MRYNRKTKWNCYQIQVVACDAKFVHCSNHQEAVATRKLPAILKTVLIEAVKVVTFIKSREMNLRLFVVLCNEMRSGHDKHLSSRN